VEERRQLALEELKHMRRKKMKIQMRPMRHLNQNSLVAMNRNRNRKLH